MNAPRSRDLANAEVIPRLPDFFDRDRGAPIPTDLIGATIVRFGAAPQVCGLEGGGLIIDYIPKGDKTERRIVLSFNELGMWVEERFPD